MHAPAKKRVVVTEDEAAAWFEIVRREEYWRNPDLTLPQLAEKMQIAQKQISRFVNDGLGVNFSEAINRLRVDAVANRLRDPTESRDILTIALDCGFNSKASFNRVFKQYTNVTPSVYRERSPTI
jgi:AraC-like DNA-binding protein